MTPAPRAVLDGSKAQIDLLLEAQPCSPWRVGMLASEQLPALYLCSVRSENERLHYDLKETSQIYHEVLKYLYATLRRHCELTRQPTRQSRWNGHVSQQLT